MGASQIRMGARTIKPKLGLIATWRHENIFVLTWEECADGDQYDEDNYTRDEVHHFQTVDDVLRFLEENALDATQFEP